jgi:DNA-binding response OmpR family regulator
MKKILVVEDDKRIVMALAVRLKAQGYDVVAAYDAVMAMSVAMQQRPDLVVLDISMPGGNGFMVAARLQNEATTAGIPLIFLTASKQPGLREQARDIGAVGFFEKPYEAADLLAAIDGALGEPVSQAQSVYNVDRLDDSRINLTRFATD